MRTTKREEDAARRRWLLARMPHAWGEEAPTRCTRCGVKFGPQASKRACPKRRKPNRWRMHFHRAQYESLRQGRPEDLHSPAWWLRQVREIAREVRHIPEMQPEHPRYGAYWQYHKLTRRYRRALRELWRLPSPAPISEGNAPDSFGGVMTRQRNELLREARRTQARVIRRKGCTYTFRPDATFENRPLFVEGGDDAR